jgi:amino acid permease
VDQAAANCWIEIIAAGTIPVGIVSVMINRTQLKKSFTVRAIQILALIIVLPIVLILSLENILAGSAVGALIGALVGYLFANISNYDAQKTGSSGKD